MSLLDKYLSLDRENANRHASVTDFLTWVMEEKLKEELSLLPADVLRAHREGLIYVHKLPLSLYIPYCTGHSPERLLRLGLWTPTITSRPARHLDAFVDHVANFVAYMQHHFTGAQALSAIEWYAGPLARRDGVERLGQELQRLVYNLNYPSRPGMQTPFVNFSMPLDASKAALERPAIIGGQETGQLGEYEREARAFLVALSRVLLEGDARGLPFTFPIPTLMTTARMLEEPEVFEAVFTAAARRGSFYWLNTRVVDPDSITAMCCRLTISKSDIVRVNSKSLRVSLKRDAEAAREEWLGELIKRRRGGIWAIPDATGSIGVITVNLPRIALESRGDDARFWELLGAALSLARRGLQWMRERYETLMAAEPHARLYGAVRRYLPEFPAAYFSTVGLIGLPETAAIVARSPALWAEGSRRDWLSAADWMRRVVSHVREAVTKWAEEEGVPYNVEEVPAESAAHALFAKDAGRFPDAALYALAGLYSSSVAPYYAPMELYDRVEVEARVQREFTGGVMMHVFLGEEPDPEALARLVRRLTATDLVYWSFTPAQTHCPRCGVTLAGLYTACPKCGSEGVEIWSRIVGYYRPLGNWLSARRKEFWTRRHYTL
jgi:ribonucleoside-triphosphate reductase